MKTLALACLTLALLAPRDAAAEVERYAVIVGNNAGDRDELTLRYAEDDAAKLHQVLVDLGGVRPENTVLLQGKNADAAERAIITVNRRIRASRGRGDQSLLIVYYSGHADARALHLGTSTLELDKLEQLVRGSAADFRLLIVDSCRSGALTRVKGGRRAPPFSIRLDERLTSEGAVILTSSSASEDAQESDTIKGSFFTHYFTSGLLGAADRDGDGLVVLDEAYQYAYENTIRASSRTMAGIQHPTFRYDLRGQGGVALTAVSKSAGRRAVLTFPGRRTYLLFRRDSDGPVVAEVSARDRRRTVSVRPGRYYVRGRGRDHLLEGSLDLDRGERLVVRDRLLRRVDYARLVRKGRGPLSRVDGPQLGYRVRSALPNGEAPCHGFFLGYEIGLPIANLGVRVGACRSGFSNQRLMATTDEIGAELRVSHAWDLPGVTLSAGTAAGAALFSQRFRTEGAAPARHSGAGLVELFTVAAVELPRGFYLATELAARAYAVPMQDESGRRDYDAAFAAQLSVALGKWL